MINFVKNVKMKYLIIILILLSSCKSQKPIVTSTTKIDTVKIKEIVKVEVPIEKIVTVEQPCDSLGNLKPIDKEIITKYVKIYIKDKDGALVVKTNIDSIIESRIETEKSSWEKEVVQLPPVKYVPNLVRYLAWIGGIGLFIVLLKVLKPFIPFLKFIP